MFLSYMGYFLIHTSPPTAELLSSREVDLLIKSYQNQCIKHVLLSSTWIQPQIHFYGCTIMITIKIYRNKRPNKKGFKGNPQRVQWRTWSFHPDAIYNREDQNVYVAKFTKGGDTAFRRREFCTHATLDTLRTNFAGHVSFLLAPNNMKLVLHINNQKKCRYTQNSLG